jgi:translocation and assembly module TamA
LELRQVVGRAARAVAAVAVLACAPAASGAWERLSFAVAGDDSELEEALLDASGLRAARRDGRRTAQDVFAAARADYARLLGALYAAGHYGATISIRLDGREAADIPPLSPPARVTAVSVRIDPGPRFRFGTLAVGPLAAGTELPEGFAPGRVAASGLVTAAAGAAVDGWRARGHARAAVAGQDLRADHRRAALDVRLAIAPGPRLRFGRLVVEGQKRTRPERIRAIAGLPEGALFDPAALAEAAERLRRTGVFASVTLVEADRITAPDLIGITAVVAEMKPRRYSFGLELSSFDGATVSAAWLHRNLFGGAERLRIWGEVRQIGAQSSGTDYVLGATLDRPATFTPDTTIGARFEIGHFDEADYVADAAEIGLTASHRIGDRLTLRGGLDYQFARVDDVSGDYTYRNLALPLGVLWDARDAPLDARRGSFLDAEVRPFLGLGSTDSGLRLYADARGYRSFGRGDRVTLAGRLQAGAVFGTTLLGTPRDYLFYSGGGGTVRGQPYQSLGIPVSRIALPGFELGGTAFLGASVEARLRFGNRLGVVAFADWGGIGLIDEGAFEDSHAGAGLGLRYDTGFGPLRLDVAGPVAGDTGDGVQIYVGLGQAF